MTTNLDPGGRSVLITGCSSGIGYATALYLAQHGFTVFATVRKEQDAQRLRALREPNLVPICPLDLTTLDDIPLVVDQVESELRQRGQRGLYALINNAGGGGVAPVELMDLEMFRRELNTRLVGALGLVQALLPLIREGQGRLVWIATPAIIPTPYVASIHACDFAVNCLARTMDIELKPWNIPCIQIRCGGVKTPAGMNTTAGEKELQHHPRAELYRGVLGKWFQDMGDFDQKRIEPERVGALVFKALTAARPKRRYSIGHMAGAAALLEALPQSAADAILKARF